MTNLCSPIIRVTCFTTLVESSQVARRNSGFCRNSFEAGVEKSDYETDCMRYGLDSRVFIITTTDGDILRYCIPMDNQRPGLDLKFFADICPDQNGASLRTLMTVFNTIIFKSLSLPYSRNTTSSGEMSKSIWRISEAQMTMYLMWRRNDFKSTTWIRLVMMLDLCG